jgi:hypothetical protein
VLKELFLTKKKFALKKNTQKIQKLIKKGKKIWISSKYRYNKIKLKKIEDYTIIISIYIN